MAHSKGKWSIGNCGSVVTDSTEGFDVSTGHCDVEYYGGCLIAESILKPADAKLIAAAPEMLEALGTIYAICISSGFDKNKIKTILEFAKRAVDKAI